MKFNNIPDFLDALEEQMRALEGNQMIESSTEIPDTFTDDEYQLFDSIREEAETFYNNEADIIDFIYTRLADLGYSDDDITQILDYEGL